MLLRHHEKTQELEYRQQRAVHALREDQVLRQHTTELCNQQDYMQRAERDLRKKHALELKQQPKSLKVRTTSRIISEYRRVILLMICISYRFYNRYYRSDIQDEAPKVYEYNHANPS